MKVFVLVLILALSGCAARTGTDGPAGPGLSREKAVSMARDFLKRQRDYSRYHTDEPVVTLRNGEYLVEFNDRRKFVKPGVCIVSVNKKTGIARIVPVE